MSAPTDQEIHDAITKVKGDVGKSAEIQALAARAWLAGTNTARGLEYAAWSAAWETARAALPAISEDIREKYATITERLQEAAAGPFKGTDDLDKLDLATLGARRVKAAAPVITDYREAKSLHGAWRTIWATLGSGAPSHWSELARPSQEQYRAARDATPQQWPTPDPWSVARKGWTGALSETLKAAGKRRADYQSAAAGTEQARAHRSIKMSLLSGGAL